MTEAIEIADRPASVFVSYTRADRPQARKLVELIEHAGFTVWWDAQIEAGGQFQQITEQALESAKAVIVIWSERSVGSAWVHDEATRGRERHCLIPVSIDGTPPPLGFRQYQFIDLSHGKMKAGSAEVEQVLSRVADLAERENEPTKPPAQLPHITRRMLLAGTGALIAVGAGYYFIGGGPGGGRPDFGSIAVLPFNNLSGDPEQDYFSDGLSEELRATLSLSRKLTVAAQTSSNSFRDQDTSATEIARKLNVSHILDGSVRRSGNTVRISTQLVNRDGFEEWSETFDREMADIFDLQTEISYLVTDALVQTLSESDGESFVRVGGTANPDALDAYLKGKSLYENARTEADDMQALAEFDRAVALDPDYAAAHAARSRSLTFIANNYTSGDELAQAYERSIEAARRAIEIAPDLAEANSALGFTLFNGRLDARAAAEPYRRSYELGFGNADMLSGYATFAGRIGDFEEARNAIARAEELDPLNPRVFRNEAVIEYGARNFAAASQALQTALSHNAELGGVDFMQGDIALLAGEFEAARAHYRSESNALARLCGMAIVESRLGNNDAAQQALVEMIEAFGDNSLYQQVQVHAQTGETGLALDLLERAYEAGDSGLVRLRNDPLLDPLRGNGRFAGVMQKIGFSDGSID